MNVSLVRSKVYEEYGLHSLVLKLGEPRIDAIIGGFRSGLLYEAAGLSGSGKTQFLYTLLTQFLHDQPEKRCIWVDTNGSFRPSRLLQIMRNRGYATAEKAISKVAVVSTSSGYDLQLALERILGVSDILMPALIIIDSSINALYETTCGNVTYGQERIRKILALMKMISTSGTVVISVNGITMYGGIPRPHLGKQWITSFTHRLVFIRTGNRYSIRIPNERPDGELDIREVTFQITDSGAQDNTTNKDDSRKTKGSQYFIPDDTLDKVLLLKFESFFALSKAEKKTLQSAVEKLGNEELENAIEIFDFLCPTENHCGIHPPFFPTESHYKVANKYGLVACSIFKNMSTILIAIMCYLHAPERILNSKWSFFEQWDRRRACYGINEPRSWTLVKQKLKREMDEITKFALVRHPMEKFMSGYTNQCLTANKCGGCQNLTCIFEMLEKNSVELRLKGLWGRSGQTRSHVNAHFLPQNWRCEFGTMLDDYVLISYNSSDSESLIRDLEHLFAEVGVDEASIKYISDKLSSGRSSHSTAGGKQRQMEKEILEASPPLMRRFLNLFYFDYLVLGYPLPDAGMIIE
ncbi:unnamed protein product, partial [Mesorhabditis belari]|uniref:RecA family profile 1 domain-containing protein n=1 Tax=Mesorhabditis belari TaxID=2138241 RepID=A0AAF3J4R5_9BILA